MLDDIIIFVKLVNIKKFSLLAKNLGVSQSTISRKIDNLENQLKVRIIKRDSHYVELTEKGKVLYENFKDFELNANNLLMQVYSDPKKITGKLKILLPSYLANHAVTPYIGEFVRKYESLDITIIYDYQNLHMTQGSYDIAITNFPMPKTIGAMTWIHSDEIIAAGTQSYVNKYGIIETPEDIDNHLAIGKLAYNQEETVEMPIYNSTTQEMIMVKNPDRFRVNSFQEVKTLVSSGEVIGGLPKASIKKELATKELIQVMPNYHFGYINFYLVRNIGYNDPRFIAFNNFLITSCDGQFKNTQFFDMKTPIFKG